MGCYFFILLYYMGKNSTEIFNCKVILSVTNAFVKKIQNSIKKSNFDGIIIEKTHNCARVIGEKWEFDRGLLGNINNGATNNGFFNNLLRVTPIGILSNVGWTHVSITYMIEVDIYNLIKNEKSKIFAQMSKLMKKKRRQVLMKTMGKSIKDGFSDAISNSPTGIISPTIVTVKSVTVSK